MIDIKIKYKLWSDCIYISVIYFNRFVYVSVSKDIATLAEWHEEIKFHHNVRAELGFIKKRDSVLSIWLLLLVLRVLRVFVWKKLWCKAAQCLSTISDDDETAQHKEQN